MNKKTLFLVITLIAMLILVTSVNAVTDNTNTSTTHSLSEKTTTTEHVVKEKIENTQTKQKTDKTQDKTITKTNKTRENTKKDPITIDGIEYTTVIENQEITDDYLEVGEVNTMYNNCTFSNTGGYIYTMMLWDDVENKPLLNHVLINNSRINTMIESGAYLHIHNSTINNELYAQGTYISIDEFSVLGENFNIETFGNPAIIYSKNPQIIEKLIEKGIYTNENTIENKVLNTPITNTGILNIKNCTLTSTIFNEGILIIDDNTVIGEKFKIARIWIEELQNKDAKVIINDSTRIGIYEGEIYNKNINTSIITNNATFINCNISAKITNQGNLTIINSTLSNVESSGTTGVALFVDNYGNCSLIGCVMENNTYTGTSSQNTAQFGMIYNNATLFIDNCTFQNNMGRRQAGIVYSYLNPWSGIKSIINVVINNSVFRNNSIARGNNFEYGGTEYNNGGSIMITNGNLTVKNTFFENHHVASSNRNNYVGSGSAVYINYCNATFDNTTFNNNSYKLLGQYDGGQSGYGAGISSQNSNLTVVNSHFNNNWVDSLSTWGSEQATGSAIAMIIQRPNVSSLIENTTFNNNHAYHNFTINGRNTIRGCGGSISIIEYPGSEYCESDIIIQHNQFNNNSASYYGGAIFGSCDKININNNSFNNIDALADTIYLKPSKSNYENLTDYTIENNTYNNCSFNYTKYQLTAPDKVYNGDNITIKLELELANPENYDPNLLEQTEYIWYLNGETITNKETEMNITVTEDNIIIYVKPTIENARTKTLTIIPTILNDIIITPENINKYLFEGELIVNHNSRLIFQGNFTDIGEINNNKNEVFIDGSGATFTNTYFIIEANNNTLQNMNINNTDTSKYIITLTGNDNTITNSTLTQYNTNGQTAAIYNNKGQNNKITQNNIKVTGPAQAITWIGTTGISNTQAILTVEGKNNIIEYNNISITNSTNPESDPFSNIEAITASQESNTTISYNNIKSTGARFNYGINTLRDVQENQIAYNNITVTGYRYADGVQVGNGATDNIISNNNIQITCLNDTPVDEAAISYGIIVTNQGGTVSNNNTITQNNININGIVNYGIEVYESSNTSITENNITLNGAKSMGIGYALSPNSTITQNNIKTIDDSNIPINGVTEEIQPKNTGIQTQQNSDNILIEDNTIQTYDKGGQDTCINIESNNVTIKNNNLTSSTKSGDATINPQPDTILDKNNAIEQNSTTQTTTEDLTIGDSTTITAQFYDDTYTPTGDGKAIFRVNGKTLRDNQGNVIYADVINGRAELPDVNITQEWMKPDTTIQAVYIGDDNNEPITTTPTTITVTKPEATITLETPAPATAGQTITLKATVTDGENNINTGRVAFKLNGKTLKDPKTGKALYAEVRDGVATITYTIPEKTKAKEYVLTVVFTDTLYDRVEAESNLNVIKA